MFEGLAVSGGFKNRIEAAVQSGRLSHALILEGSDSETRLNAAKEIAKAIVCETDTERPCGKCPGCKKCGSMSHPDVHFLFKDDSVANIKVDQIRQLKHDAGLVPNDCDKSVFIIHEAQYMNPQAQNALLKIFEEPSAYVTFILTCNSKSALLETIISRATDYFLSSDSNENDGRLEEAYEQASKLIRYLCKKTEFDFLCQTAYLQKDKQKFGDILSAFYGIFADALAYKNGIRDNLISERTDTAKLLNETFTEKKLLDYIDATNSLIENFNSSANANLLLTRLSSVYFGIKLH